MNHRKPKTAKIILGLNLGLYHHVLNSCCPSKASCSEYLYNLNRVILLLHVYNSLTKQRLKGGKFQFLLTKPYKECECHQNASFKPLTVIIGPMGGPVAMSMKPEKPKKP